MNKIITISREFGSDGRELGRCLAQQLHFAYYDQEIIHEISHRTELSENYIQHITESRPSFVFPIHTGRSFLLLNNPVWQQNQLIFKEQCDIIREAAERSSCIIVGRCADYILRDRQPFRIFVYADMETKLHRCRQRESEEYTTLNDKELQRKIKEIDRSRSRYYEFFTEQKWSDRMNYDFCVNTTHTTVQELAPALAKLFI